MNEDRLIRTLVADLRPVPAGPRIGRGLAAFLVWSGLSVAVMSRGHMAVADPMALAILCGVIAAAGLAAIASAIPGRVAGRGASLVAALLLIAWTVENGLTAAALRENPAALWGVVPWVKCFAFTLVFGAVPTFALVRIVNRGWSVRPSRTAALTFLAGAAAGGLTIALECPSLAPLHVLLGHVLPIVGAGALGATLARRLPGFRGTTVRMLV